MADDDVADGMFHGAEDKADLGTGGTDGSRERVASLTTVLVEDLTAAGFPIALGDAVGGICLTPSVDPSGVVVRWTQQERAVAVFGELRHREVQERMSDLLVDILWILGYAVEYVAATDAHVVTGWRASEAIGRPAPA